MHECELKISESAESIANLNQPSSIESLERELLLIKSFMSI